MKKITNFLFSTRLMSVAVLAFAFAMAAATFIENDYGTQTAKAVIYNSWWFEVLMYLLTLNFIGNIFRYRLYRKEKWAILLFHLAFVITLFGAFITRYFGYEGLMPIREGTVSNTILTDNTYLYVRVDDNKDQKEFEKKVLFGNLGKNHFTVDDEFRGKPFSVKYVNYISNVKNEFVKDDNSQKHLHLVISTSGGRKDLYLKDQSTTKYGNLLFSYNKTVSGAMNFFETDNNEIYFQPAIEGSFMEMQTRKETLITPDSIAPLQFLKLYSFPKLQFIVSEKPVKGKVQLTSAPVSKKNQFPYDAVVLDVSSGEQQKQIVIQGAKNAITEARKFTLNGLNFIITYGAKAIQTPFSIKLRDFELKRYPGTHSASSYASEVTVIDKDKTFDYRIFMNHVLDYKGFRFFQASFDQDEKGTILSVNHDYWGTLITYIGYILMGIGMFFSLFIKSSRFKKLSDKLKENADKAVLILLLLTTGFTTVAQETNSGLPEGIVSKAHADKFGKLLILGHDGRVKPVNTYALEALRKVYKKDTYKGLSAEQVLLSAQLDPAHWSQEYIIKIVFPTAVGSKVLNDLKAKDKLTSLNNFLPEGNYYLEEKVAESFRKKNIDRNATDKEIINLDERVNIWWNLLSGNLLTIYPKKGDPNNKWYSGIDRQVFKGKDSMMLKVHQLYFSTLQKAVKTNDYSEADKYLGYIAQLQKDIAGDFIPPATKIDLEIKYNKWNIFKKLMFYYMIIGFIFLILAFVNLFKPHLKTTKLLLQILAGLTVIGMIAHVAGMGVRWYISGHEPWSNGYEAVVFVAFVTILAGLLFSKNKSKFPLAVTVIFASFLLGIAHGSMMNPEITNLVPVLKSYWLMIHVAVITSSYGFLGLGSLLGFVVLLLYIFRNPENAKRFDETIDELTYINESTLTIGLYTLSIGTFLGGVWANESWGRYWSWDPKEVWSLISMMVYIFVLHMRIVPGLRGKFAFNLASLFSIATLIMTFFGVNYYLSGMHSYAAGDPIPIPVWIYYAIAFFILFSILSYIRYKKFKDNKK